MPKRSASRRLRKCLQGMLLSSALVGAAQAETLIIAGDIWCPVNCVPGSAQPGIFVELAQEIFAEAGIQVQYKTLNWARTLREVRMGELNAAIGAGVEDAPDFLFTPTPVAQSRYCFYTREESTWDYTGVASLPGQRLGVINDYSYGEQLNAYVQAHGKSEQVQAAAGDKALELNLGKLQRDRLDVVLENSWVMQAALAAAGSKPLREAGCRKPDVPIYLAFSPARADSQRYVELFENGLQRYRANGRLQALLVEYGVTK